MADNSQPSAKVIDWGSEKALPPRAPHCADGERSPVQEDPMEDPPLDTMANLSSDVDCLLIGPRATGKTSFIGSLEQACLLGSNGPYQLRLFGSSRLHRQTQRVVRSITSTREISSEPTEESATHVCDVGLHNRHTGLRRVSNLRIREEPGCRFFTTDEERHACAALWPEPDPPRERCLVLFIDSLNPDIPTWRGQLPGIVGRLRRSPRNIETGSGSGLAQAQVLGVDRILILLTKVDLLCLELLRHTSSLNQLTGYHSTPLDLARRIDPVQQAVEFFGQANLTMLRSLVAQNGDLAIGLVSAAGFDPRSGQSLLAGAIHCDEIIKHWTPYGVRDAFYFMMYGEPTGHLAVPQQAGTIAPAWRRMPMRRAHTCVPDDRNTANGKHRLTT